MYDAVIFDCDGVLVDSEILHIEAEIETLAECGLTYELDAYKGRFLGMHHSAFFPALDADFRARLGAPLPADFPARLYARYDAMEPRMAAVAGAAEAVRGLSGLRAVASSSQAPALRRKLEGAGLTSLFDPHVYSADLVAHGKPRPDIFLYAAEQLGVAPARCLVIEDSVNGVLAGRAAGMTVWGFSGGGHMDATSEGRLIEAGAERIVPTWAAAEALWRAWR
jgi:HAD superfamily hydrolase (TIGR01509 family)